MKRTVRRKKETTKGGRNFTNGRAMLAPTEQRGITLIALIITIIVMLILLAVTVTTVVNSGLFGKAGEASTKWANAQEQESSLGDGTYVSNMVNQYANGIENSGGNGGETPGGGSGGTTIPEPEPEPEPEVDRTYLKVGDYVDYTPDAAASYSLLEEFSGYSKDQTMEQESLKWRILSINEDGSVSIVSSFPTDEEIYFEGALGYNNGVYILNDMCKKLYSNAGLGVEARSINLQDIESKMSAKGIAARDAYTNSNGVTYGETQTYTGTNAYTPDIYKNVSKDTEGETLDYYTTPTTFTSTQESSLEAKQTDYDITLDSSYFDDGSYYDLLYSYSVYYWIASRSVDCKGTTARFNLRKGLRAKVSSEELFLSNEKIYNVYSCGLMPIVTLGSDVHISETGGTEDSPRTLTKI